MQHSITHSYTLSPAAPLLHGPIFCRTKPRADVLQWLLPTWKYHPCFQMQWGHTVNTGSLEAAMRGKGPSLHTQFVQEWQLCIANHFCTCPYSVWVSNTSQISPSDDDKFSRVHSFQWDPQPIVGSVDVTACSLQQVAVSRHCITDSPLWLEVCLGPEWCKNGCS